MADEEDSTPIEAKYQSTLISRRDALRFAGSVLAVAPLSSLLGCDSKSEREEVEEADTVAKSWASGGTAGLTALASYPDPFASDAGTSCAFTCQTTLGPCHDDLAPEREDISEGHPGLPMRLGFRVVDENCNPVRDANVDIWHPDPAGAYSSETTDLAFICGANDAEALAARWFRGHQMTDENGVAWFNTCFPGWYSGRALHIHFTVRRSTRAGDEYLTSQLTFEEELINEINTTHPDYMPHGVPDTPSKTDLIFAAGELGSFMFQTQRMSDGAMLAWKEIVIRSELSEKICGDSGEGLEDLLDGLLGGLTPA